MSFSLRRCSIPMLLRVLGPKLRLDAVAFLRRRLEVVEHLSSASVCNPGPPGTGHRLPLACAPHERHGAAKPIPQVRHQHRPQCSAARPSPHHPGRWRERWRAAAHEAELGGGEPQAQGPGRRSGGAGANGTRAGSTCDAMEARTCVAGPMRRQIRELVVVHGAGGEEPSGRPTILPQPRRRQRQRRLQPAPDKGISDRRRRRR